MERDLVSSGRESAVHVGELSFVDLPYDRPFLLTFGVEISFGSYICITLYTLVEEAVKLLRLVSVRAAHAVLSSCLHPTGTAVLLTAGPCTQLCGA